MLTAIVLAAFISAPADDLTAPDWEPRRSVEITRSRSNTDGTRSRSRSFKVRRAPSTHDRDRDRQRRRSSRRSRTC